MIITVVSAHPTTTLRHFVYAQEASGIDAPDIIFRAMQNALGPHSSYTVRIPVYEGPLDLLLGLIERAELDITTVSLAMVTDQYLAYIQGLEQSEADDISAFLVIAAPPPANQVRSSATATADSRTGRGGRCRIAG